MMVPTGPSPLSPEESSFGHRQAHESCDLDLIFKALSHPVRREVLCFLDAEFELTIDELAAKIGTLDNFDANVPMDDPRIVLQHHHLPVLVKAELVEISEDVHWIRRGERFALVRNAVDAAMTIFPTE